MDTETGKLTDNFFLYSEEEKLFFEENEHASIPSLMLKKSFTARQKYILQQIAWRQKIEKKLPTFYLNKNIHYPSAVSTEQCSSEKTAVFKASLFNGKNMADLCAGMGVDSYFISKNFEEATLIELQTDIANSTKHNLVDILQAQHIIVLGGITAEEFIEKNTTHYDLLYIDPSRRNTHGGRVYKLDECVPNVVALLPLLLSHSNKLLIKTSPLLDIVQTCKELQYVSDIYCVAIENECKELLFIVDKTYSGDYKIHAVNLDKNIEINFTLEEEQNSNVFYSTPKKYLYEPDVCIMKAGCFKFLCVKYEVEKLHPNSHLYTSNNLVNNFPGKIFEIISTIKVDKKDLEKKVPEKKGNLSIRNFPDNVDTLRKKIKLQDGGDKTIFATTLMQEDKVLIICKKNQQVD